MTKLSKALDRYFELAEKGRMLGQGILHGSGANCQVTGGCYLCQAQNLRAKIKMIESRT